ncbi:TAP domain-containing protein [Paraburkholderia ribeironis]|uniref:TAP domain-containing protein n=1 Tax=Paraburkholderia ribeironis TaxID=1247936 RepID=A0A1N7RSU1_9BURK|nr:alpha/beta hydrolase [Paraburkholderia ribeironis]SIT38169.1 TAP domain-containing protein [Paraburkholderia ribeironis]
MNLLWIKETQTRIGMFAVLLTMLGLYGCGGSDGSPDADPKLADADAKLAPYYTQAISWHDCSSGNFQGLDEDLLYQLSSRTRCASVMVPLDYDDISKGNASIGILKVSAGRSAGTLGAIWTNPGGPGESGLNMPLGLSKLWLLGNSANPLGEKFLRLTDAYDVIGFDPRGVGSSVQLVCSSNATAGFIPFTDRSAATINAQMKGDRDVASACGGTPLTPYINTEYTARDMEVIRVALGYDKLNYYGASYGTALGARYASLFPDHTGRMILDSVMDINLPISEYAPGQAPAFQKILDGIVAPYVAARNDVFGLGTNAEGVKNIARTGPAWLTSWLGHSLPSWLYSQSMIEFLVAHLAAAKGINSLLAANPTISPNDLQTAVDTLQFFPQGNRAAESIARQAAVNAVGSYRAFLSGATQLQSFNGTFRSVTCNDGPLTHHDQQYWIDLGNLLAQSAPLIGGRYSSQPCLYWPFTPRRLPTFGRASTLPILLLHNENDGATPLSGARATAAVLKGSRLVVQDMTYNHGAAYTGSPCVNGYMADYLLQGTLPQGNVTCAGNGLPAELKTMDLVSKFARGGAAIKANPNDMYSDSIQAEKVLQKLRDMIR